MPSTVLVEDTTTPNTPPPPTIQINLRAANQLLPVTLTTQQSKSMTWGALCKHLIETGLQSDNSTVLLRLLTNMSSPRRVTHYVLRYGDATATLVKVHWSPYAIIPTDNDDEPSHPRVGYIDANVVLKPRAMDDVNLKEFVQPFQLVQPPKIYMPPSIDVDLCVELLTPKIPPYAYNIRRASILYVREQELHLGHVDTMSVEQMTMENRNLPRWCCNPEFIDLKFGESDKSGEESDGEDGSLSMSNNDDEEEEVSEMDGLDSESSSSMLDDEEDNDDDENDNEESEAEMEDEEDEDGDASGGESS